MDGISVSKLFINAKELLLKLYNTLPENYTMFHGGMMR